MNDNTITVMAVPLEEEEAELDLMDLLAELLLKWKVILAFILIGTVLGYGWAYFKNNNSAESVTMEKTAESVKSQLSADQAVAVEQLFFQYVSYLELQKEMRTYYGNFVASNVNVENTIQMRKEYYIVSNIKDLDTVFIKMAVTEADYQAMREIAPDNEAGATIYDRIEFTTAYNEKIQTYYYSDAGSPLPSKAYSTAGSFKSSDQDGEESAYLINIELYANSEEQCRDMMAIIDAAFRRETQELRVLDPDIRMESLGEQFNYNVAEYVQNLHKKNIDRMTISETELANLNTKIGKFSSSEKSYFDLLQQQYDGVPSMSEENISWKKWTMIGAFLGVVTAFCVVFFPYLMSGRVQSPCELAQSSKLLNRVFIKGNKNMFGRWAARLIHTDDTDPMVKAEMVATDINIMMEKTGKNTVLLLCGEEDTNAVSFAEQVKTRLLAKDRDLNVSIGNPQHSVEELEMAAHADMGVVFAEMKKSKKMMLREWKQICMRYKLPLAGSVAVRRCW